MLNRLFVAFMLLLVISAVPGCGESEPTAAGNGVAAQPTAEDPKPPDKKGAMTVPKEGK
jgi:hypothetical protein